jgi:hypothetical protein
MTDFVKVSHKKRRNNKSKSNAYIPPHLRKHNVANNHLNMKSDTEFPTLSIDNQSEISETPLSSTKFKDLFNVEDDEVECNKIENDIPYGWVKIRKDGTFIHSVSEEERNKIEEENEIERQRLIMKEMKDKHEQFKQTQRENPFSGYESESTHGTNDEYYSYEEDQNNDDSNGEYSDNYEDY